MTVEIPQSEPYWVVSLHFNLWAELPSSLAEAKSEVEDAQTAFFWSNGAKFLHRKAIGEYDEAIWAFDAVRTFKAIELQFHQKSFFRQTMR